jgi:hypothetical protein
MHERIWKAASEGAAARPASIMAVLSPVNELIDLHATRLAAARKRLPYLIIGLLILCSAMSIAGIGYGCGISDRRNLLMTGSLVFLVVAALGITIDLDNPRVGLLQLNDAPLEELALSGEP